MRKFNTRCGNVISMCFNALSILFFLVTSRFTRADSLSPKSNEINYSYIFIAHPRAITGFSWRKTSKYMPRGAVANMLITSCRDNISRIWCETVLPEDGLVDVQQLDSGGSTSLHHTNRHKNRLLQKIHHVRSESACDVFTNLFFTHHNLFLIFQKY